MEYSTEKQFSVEYSYKSGCSGLGQPLFQNVFRPMHRRAEKHGHQAAADGQQRHFARQHNVKGRGLHRKGSGAHSQRQGDAIGDNGGHQAGEIVGVVDLAHADHHDGKDGGSHRGAEQRGKKGGHSGHGDGAQVAVIQMEQAPGVKPDRAAHLQRSAFASGGTAAQMR